MSAPGVRTLSTILEDYLRPIRNRHQSTVDDSCLRQQSTNLRHHGTGLPVDNPALLRPSPKYELGTCVTFVQSAKALKTLMLDSYFTDGAENSCYPLVTSLCKIASSRGITAALH